jgi:hypothetical protein
MKSSLYIRLNEDFNASTLDIISLMYLVVTFVYSLIVDLISNVVDLILNLVTLSLITSVAISMMHTSI